MRRKAEGLSEDRGEDPLGIHGPAAAAELRRLVHELQVHQIELQLQNEELRRVQLELDDSLVKHFDLYDLAPVGYCTLNEKGLILKVNLAMASLLGSPRGQVAGHRFSSYILREDQDVYYRHRPKSRKSTATSVFELRMHRELDPPFWARIDLKVLPAAEGPLEYLLAVTDVTERRQREGSLLEYNRTLEDQRKAQASLLEHLSARLLTAQDDERKRIALDLHDSLGQTLSALRLMGGRVVGADSDGKGGHLSCTPAMMAILSGAIEEVRRISMDLRPSMLDDLGILPTLSWFLRSFKVTHPQVQVKKQLRVLEAAIPEALKITLYRIVQEAFHNAGQHGHASLIHLTLSLARGTLTLKVVDNGQGFDPAAVDRASTGAGLGLSSMRERAESSGGTFAVASAPGKGTQLLACWPLSAPAAAEAR